MSTAYKVLELERDEHVGTLWLASPERRNAMGPDFWRELPLGLAELESDPEVRSIVIAARGSAFTVGLDLKAMLGSPAAGLLAGADGEQSEAASRIASRNEILHLQRSISSVADCRKPVIAAIHGYCLGGGIDLITAADIRLASRDAVFSIRETRIAIVADVGTLQRLPAIIGPGLTAELAFTGTDFHAERAREIGLVNHVYEDAAATQAAAAELARSIARNSPLAVQGTKQVLRYCAGKSVADGLDYVATWNAAFLKSDDLGEAMRAFLEKRPPRFTGR
jgi:enoyl-CoA hydratase